MKLGRYCIFNHTAYFAVLKHYTCDLFYSLFPCLLNLKVIQVKILPYHINDPEFANELVDSFLKICKCVKGQNHHQTVSKPDEDLKTVNSGAGVSPQNSVNISYSLNDFPNAKPGCYFFLSYRYDYDVLIH